MKHVSLPGLVWSSCIIFANSGNPGEDGLAAVDVFHCPLAEEKVNVVLKIKQDWLKPHWVLGPNPDSQIVNKTGLRPVSKPREQEVGFLRM